MYKLKLSFKVQMIQMTWNIDWKATFGEFCFWFSWNGDFPCGNVMIGNIADSGRACLIHCDSLQYHLVIICTNFRCYECNIFLRIFNICCLIHQLKSFIFQAHLTINILNEKLKFEWQSYHQEFTFAIIQALSFNCGYYW